MPVTVLKIAEKRETTVGFLTSTKHIERPVERFMAGLRKRLFPYWKPTKTTASASILFGFDLRSNYK